jgi:hypothetical protein
MDTLPSDRLARANALATFAGITVIVVGSINVHLLADVVKSDRKDHEDDEDAPHSVKAE